MLDLNALSKTLDKIERILESDLTWEVKYDLIFELCNAHLWGNLPGFSYYDPDTSYEADVKAVYEALIDYLHDRVAKA